MRTRQSKISALIIMLIWCQVITRLLSCPVLHAAKALSIELFNGITVKLIRLNMIINISVKEATQSMNGDTALTFKLSVAGY